MVQGDVENKFVRLERYLHTRAQSSSFVFQIILLRLICVGVCIGCNVWLYLDFLAGRTSPDLPSRDLHGTFNCKLPDQYQWTEKINCDTNDVDAACEGSVTSHTNTQKEFQHGWAKF